MHRRRRRRVGRRFVCLLLRTSARERFQFPEAKCEQIALGSERRGLAHMRMYDERSRPHLFASNVIKRNEIFAVFHHRHALVFC